MATAYTRAATTRNNPPQSKPIPGREPDMGQNDAGGFVFKLDKWKILDRFLILGTENGTYYATEQKHTERNLDNLAACVKEDGPRVVSQVLDLDRENRAPKMDPLIFAIAFAQHFGSPDTKELVSRRLGELLRTGTHYFMYLDALKSLGAAMSRSKRRAMAQALGVLPVAKLAFLMMKYASRDGWSWRDLLRLSHVKADTESKKQLFKFVTKGGKPGSKVPAIVKQAQMCKDPAISDKKLAALIREYKLPHEFIPTERQNGDVLLALAENMPPTALLRQLARLTAAGVIKPLSEFSRTVADKISDDEWLKKARVHPIQILSALMTYQSAWTPVPAILDALEKAFFASFKHVVPTGKRILIALDVSGSMGWSNIAKVPGLTPATASACLALVTAKSEKNYFIFGFAEHFKPLGITSADTLESAMRKTAYANFGRTDCAVPMIYAREKGLEVDAFIIFTDSETWYGGLHPKIALDNYRKSYVKDAKLIVVGMTATDFSINDPNDPNGMDIVGFDSAAPQIMSDFIRGEM